eukprot:m.136906 g.136906  ORF g.136906 m.136906 type:complete len:56 (+) comp14893_c1_seq8:2742-2909(+)
MTEWRLTKSVAAQMAALRSGFEEIMPLQHLAIFDEREVEVGGAGWSASFRANEGA